MLKRTSTMIAALFMAGMINLDLAHADVHNYWSSPAASCVPDEAAIQGNRYFSSAGGVGFNSGVTSVIDLWCPVQRNTGATNPGGLWLTAGVGGTGSSTNFAKASFWSKSRSTGTATQIASVQTPASSGSFHIFVNFTHTLNFNTNHYYVLGSIDRDSTQATSIRGVALGSAG
jgi:hypothetical protein